MFELFGGRICSGNWINGMHELHGGLLPVSDGLDKLLELCRRHVRGKLRKFDLVRMRELPRRLLRSERGIDELCSVQHGVKLHPDGSEWLQRLRCRNIPERHGRLELRGLRRRYILSWYGGGVVDDMR